MENLHKIELVTGGCVYMDEEAWEHFEGQANHHEINSDEASTSLYFSHK